MTNKEPLLSVVVVSRNDDHGGNMLQRMQLFVSGWIEQSKRFSLPSELVIVEWNPPVGRQRLAEVLQLPEEVSPCIVRFIEVPSELHRRFKNSESLPLFQMIGKNVGIRRARGRFVLATNIDILFSDELMEFFAYGKLLPGYMYRIDRYDVPSDLPNDSSIEKQLDYCREHVIRVNMQSETIIKERERHNNGTSIFGKQLSRIHNYKNDKGVFQLLKDVLFLLTQPIMKIVIRPLIYGKPLHTNACGDFTLMTRDDWMRLRGNAEFETFSLHLDGLMCIAAHHGGVREVILEDPMRIYHIEHAPGSGWSPGAGAKLLEERLNKADISQLNYKEYLKYYKKIRWHRGPMIFNDENWGLGQEPLHENVFT